MAATVTRTASASCVLRERKRRNRRVGKAIIILFRCPSAAKRENEAYQLPGIGGGLKPKTSPPTLGAITRKHDGPRNRNACRLCRRIEVPGHPARGPRTRESPNARFPRQRHPRAARRGIDALAIEDAGGAGARRQGPLHRVRRHQDLDTGGRGAAPRRARPIPSFPRHPSRFLPPPPP